MIENVIISLLGGLGTYFLGTKFLWSPVKSSALITLVFAGLITLIHQFHSLNTSDLLCVFFGSTFIGMASSKIFNYASIVFSSIIFGILFSIIDKHFNSIGGTLGVTACISCLVLFLINTLLIKIKK